MEAGERPERGEAEEGLENMEALRDRAPEGDEENVEGRPSEKAEARDPHDERQSGEGLEELWERAPDPDEQKDPSASVDTKETARASEASATVEGEPRPESEPASGQDVKLEDGAGVAQAARADDPLEAVPRNPPDGVQEEPDSEREAEEGAGKQVGRRISYENQVTVTEQEAPSAKQDAEAKLETEDLRRLQDSSFEYQAVVPNPGRNRFPESNAKLESSRKNVGDSPTISKPLENLFQGTDRASAQTGEVGREIEHELHGIVLTRTDPVKEPDKLVPRRQAEREDSIEVLKATGYGYTSALLVPERMIPPHDQRSDIFEVRVSRESEPEKEFPMYTTHKPGYDRAYLNLYQMDPERWEVFRVKPVTPYIRSDFVEEYNKAKPRGLENTALVERGEGLYLKVGENELPFAESKLRVYQGRVVLDGKIEGAREVKISKALDGFDFRLKDHSRVTSIKEGPQGAMLSYERTGHDPYPHRRIILEGKAESFPTAKREAPLIVGRIEVRSRTMEGYTLRFGLKADEEAVEHVMNELDSARNVDEFRKLKGDIAEELVKRVGPNLGLIVRADHPFNDDPLKTGSERTGPDLLASLGAHGDLSYVEVKWWAIKANATREATMQVQQDIRKHPTWDGLPVRVAYTAIVDWRPESDEFSLTLERVDSKSIGAHDFNR